MVLCFLPGTRPASVMLCMMSACCYTWPMMLFWLDILLPVLSKCTFSFNLFFFFMFTTFVLGFVSLLPPFFFFFFVFLLLQACIIVFDVILCTDTLKGKTCCSLFQLQYLPPPWGDCKSSAMDSEYFSTYSITACRIDCETRYLQENCNCKMVHMPGMNWDWLGQ